MKSLFDLKGQVVTLIGAGGLIGQQLAHSLYQEGAHLALVDINRKSIDELASQITEDGDSEQRVQTYEVDITSTGSVNQLIQAIDRDYSKIDTLINNAYPRNKNYGRHFFDVEYTDFCENMGLHLGGYFLTTQKFGQYFKEQKQGNIINISSIYGVIAPKFEVYDNTTMTMPVEYSAIKAGLIHLTKYTAKYLGPYGVRANCLSPGGVENGQDPTFIQAYNQYCGAKGMLKPSDLGGATVFLASPSSQYLNGQNLVIDDGFTL